MKNRFHSSPGVTQHTTTLRGVFWAARAAQSEHARICNARMNDAPRWRRQLRGALSSKKKITLASHA